MFRSNSCNPGAGSRTCLRVPCKPSSYCRTCSGGKGKKYRYKRIKTENEKAFVGNAYIHVKVKSEKLKKNLENLRYKLLEKVITNLDWICPRMHICSGAKLRSHRRSWSTQGTCFYRATRWSWSWSYWS